ncbi:hypothetical protein NPIL_585051 [Nephila pilipes]|uniref:Uncharacterized protein n=1 Tax=Nephila pilipes TaxID=299642 RepID=A0A8X6QGH2_NEPPI|nr:hypothetical protein NPIL_585051 [Nephila pilipes]
MGPLHRSRCEEDWGSITSGVPVLDGRMLTQCEGNDSVAIPDALSPGHSTGRFRFFFTPTTLLIREENGILREKTWTWWSSLECFVFGSDFDEEMVRFQRSYLSRQYND